MVKKYEVSSKVVTVPARVLEITRFVYDVQGGSVTLYVHPGAGLAPFRKTLTQEQFDELMPKIVKEIDDIMDEVADELGGIPVTNLDKGEVQ